MPTKTETAARHADNARNALEAQLLDDAERISLGIAALKDANLKVGRDIETRVRRIAHGGAIQNALQLVLDTLEELGEDAPPSTVGELRKSMGW